MSDNTSQVFPIVSDTACLLKWAWSTVFLSLGTTSSCHRCDHDQVPAGQFDTFHNTPRKLLSREIMRRGEWPQAGCQYCQKIESAGGMSDRQFQLVMNQQETRVPVELLSDPTANAVTPTVMEMYFTNTCNMACLYCGPHFSSLWQKENEKHGLFHQDGIHLSSNNKHAGDYDQRLQEFWNWFEKNHLNIRFFHVLGGEPFYQDELIQLLDFFETHPNPHLQLVLVSNLKVGNKKFRSIIDRMMDLKQRGHLLRIQITGSLDCWGPQQEFVRWGLDLQEWTENFEYILSQDIIVNINGAISSLTVKTMPEYIEKINYWNQLKKDLGFTGPASYISYSFMTVTSPTDHMRPDIFGPGVFDEDFQKILAAMPTDTDKQRHDKEHMAGIARQIAAAPRNDRAITGLKTYLNEISRRRGTDWKPLFPWLDQL